MSTSASLLFDDLGPRGRRRVHVASVGIGAALLAVVAFALNGLYEKGQLDADRWEPLTQWPVIRFLLGGLWNTLRAAAVAMLLSVLIGALMALGRLARNPPVRWLAGIYVELFRALPLLFLILFPFLALPGYLDDYGIRLDPYWYLVAGLTLYNSAMLAEIFRAGILSLDRGQREAALSIGLTYWQSMLLVIIPQAGRRMVPAILSQLVALLKDTALGYVIIFEELLRRARILGEFEGNLLQAYFIVAVMYFVVCYALSRVARRLEVRQRRRYNAAPLDVAGAEEIAVVSSSATPRL